MAGIEFFEREIKLATKDLNPENIDRLLAQFARQQIGEAVMQGSSKSYVKYVNGRQGAAEETVKAPGPIVYVFTNWPLVIEGAIEELQKRVPRRTGRYATSFNVLADQQPVARYDDIAPDAEVIIFNYQPYTRKMEVGANRTGKRHFDLSKAALSRRFGAVFKFETRFLDVKNGVAPGVPYILKRSRGKRRDRQAGQPISYPSIVINML